MLNTTVEIYPLYWARDNLIHLSAKGAWGQLIYDLLFARQWPFQNISPLLTRKVTLVRLLGLIKHLLALRMFYWIAFVI